jgi:tetratricopeptide (TPR) repeat protein
MAPQYEPPPAAIQEEMERILASETLARADKSRDFLRLVVSKKLAGEDTKELLIGIEIYGSRYDPVADGGRVRQLARGVRKLLERYYSGPGSADPIRISIPEGGYNPKFEIVPVPPVPKPDLVARLIRWLLRRWRQCLAVAGLSLAIWVAVRVVLPRFLRQERHIAVLPFETVDTRPESQQFRKALLFSLVYRLNQFGRLTIERADDVLDSGVTSSAKACRAFGAGLVVSGSIESVEGKTRVTISVSRCASARQVDSAMVESQLSGSFPLEDLVAQRLAEMLRLKVEEEIQTRASSGTLQPQAEDFYLRARGYLLEGRGGVDNAILLFREARQADGNFALAHAGLGEAYIRKYEVSREGGLIKLARESCDQAIRINSNLAPVHITQGLIYNTIGEYQKAVQEYREAVRLEPNNADAYGGLAVAYDRLGQVNQAEDTYKAAIQRRSGYWGAYKDLAVFLFDHGHYAEAERAFLSAARLAPDNFAVHRDLGGTYLVMGRYVEAEKELTKSLDLKPNPEAYNNLSALYSLRGEYQKAVEPMERVVDMNRSNPLMAGNLARTYRYAGQTVRAAAEYKRAIQLAREQLEINPRQAVFRAELARMLAESQAKAEARGEIERALAEGPANSNVLIRAVFTYEMLHDRPKALNALARIAQNTKGCLPMQIRRNPDLKDLRSAPEYRALASACKDNQS